ncbi:prephenate dehydratase [Ichthyobacterium seriolicida]|uniref:Bifunctional chorismate mutase/prephenate dehydratase n=1 Tax=Ichthyobacterium seriolicida TaxID=242600 RepID=A0A1J1EBJ7_9FLAO|nr:prephenate dehydratase [Ichthyobacterium seriolicida]BAV95299.1 prephenate dehydratase [Ichthyobacterium seriolicida]
MKKTVAIQGVKGSYHHIAAMEYFSQPIDIVECDSFRKMPDLINQNKVDLAIMAIENSIAGSILSNYSIILNNNIKVIGEYYLSISHCLMTIKGQDIGDIKEIYSHPMAILQCEEYLKRYPNIKLVETENTALSAKKISNENLINIAAIASETAGNIYKLSIIDRDIQTKKNNFTRFFIIAKTNIESLRDKDKASIKFSLKHQPGNLADILNTFSSKDINLTKIQSIPIIDKPWEYSFIVDFLFKDENHYSDLMRSLEGKCNDIEIIGKYKSCLI